MKRLKRSLSIVLSFLMALTLLPVATASAATADYVSITKTVNPVAITSEQEAEVTLEVKGTPPANVIVPNDVVLIIDKSGSMLPGSNNGEDKMTNAKEAAKGFIDLMDMTKHRVGIVDFSSASMIGTFDFTSDKTAAKQYVNGISASGTTATGDAIRSAVSMLENHRPEAQPVIVIMTDGDATDAGSSGLSAYNYAKQQAQLAKDAGIVFYTIALLKSTDNPDTSGPNLLLRDMATTSVHHHFVLGSTGLAEIYAAIVKEIGIASAYDVTVTDTVDANFEIVPGSYTNNIPVPTVQGNTLVWSFAELKNSTLQFKYKIRPKDKTKAGNFYVGAAGTVTYKDYAGSNKSKAIPNATIKVTLPPPTITSIVENSGPLAGGNTVVITGTHFVPGATVTIGNNAAYDVVVVSDTEIQAKIPVAASVGSVTVKVTNPDRQFATTQYAYKENPVVSSYTPSHGPLAGGTVVTFTGKNLMTGIKVKFGAKQAIIQNNNSLTYLQVVVPAGDAAGAVDIVLDNPDGTTLTIPNGYTYDAPIVPKIAITSVQANTGLTTGGETVYINGQLFDPAVKIYFGVTEAVVKTYYNDTKVLVTVPANATAGAVDVTAVNPNGDTATLQGGYTYTAPPEAPPLAFYKITPASGLVSGGDLVYIDGAGFQTGVKVYVGGQEATVLNFYSAARLRVAIPAGQAPGLVDVRIVNPDSKELVASNAYEYLPLPAPPALQITKIAPVSGPTAGGTLSYIDGAGFQVGVKIYYGGVEGTVTNFYSGNRIRVQSPPAAQGGFVDIKIVNPDGKEIVQAGAFEYIAPPPEPVTITSITPNNGTTAGGNEVTLAGVNFKPGATVLFGSNAATISSFLSAAKVKVIVPAAAAQGAVDVTYTNLDGQTYTLTQGYTYSLPSPTITMLSATTGPMAGGTSVYIDGTNFDPAMTVTVGTTAVPITNYYSAARIRIITPVSAVSGPVSIKVTLPNGNSASATFTYDAPPVVPPPVITKMGITSASSSGGTLFYIDGSGFQTGMKIYFGTTEGTITQFYSAARIRVKVPAGTAGTVSVYLLNPDGQQSAPITFTYS